jgi:hypothetical protein
MSANGCGGGFRITAAGVVGVSAKPVRIYGYTMRSGAGGAGLVNLYDGTANTGAERWAGAGNMDSGAIVSFGERGKFFPTGCYCDIDANVTYVEFDYEQVNI